MASAPIFGLCEEDAGEKGAESIRQAQRLTILEGGEVVKCVTIRGEGVRVCS